MNEPITKDAVIDILHVANWLQGKLSEILSPFDVSLQQVKVLAIIHQQPKQCASVGIIREQMDDPMSNVSRLINKLMEKKLIRKEHGVVDQRNVYVHILPLGIEVMEKSRKAIDQQLDALCHLSNAELHSLRSLLNKIKAR